MTTTNRSLLTLTVAILLLTGYNFLGAAWTPAAGTPPANNTDAPVNIGATTQAKSGNLSANIFAATTEVRSNRYCDALGGNCVDSSSVGGASWGTWTNMVGSRVGRVWYHNNAPTGRAVHYQTSYGANTVFVSPTGTSSNQVAVSSPDGDSGEWGPGFFIVPAGHYYWFNNTTAFRNISELQLPF